MKKDIKSYSDLNALSVLFGLFGAFVLYAVLSNLVATNIPDDVVYSYDSSDQYVYIDKGKNVVIDYNLRDSARKYNYTDHHFDSYEYMYLTNCKPIVLKAIYRKEYFLSIINYRTMCYKDCTDVVDDGDLPDELIKSCINKRNK